MKDDLCAHCEKETKKSECYQHCHENLGGKHTPNWPRAEFSDDLPTDGVVVDVPCMWCGTTASALITTEDISWE